MKFTQIPADTFKNLQMNAGIITSGFDPDTGEVPENGIIGATTGGVSFSDSVEYIDFGEDIDNCPKNMMELKKLDSHDVKMSGTFVAVSADTAKMLVAVGDKDGNKIVPRNTLEMSDFMELWWIGDYSDVNTGADAGFLAIKLLNALNTGGFQIQSTDKGKGTFAFEFTGHYSMDAQEVVPYEIYVKGSGGSDTPGVTVSPKTQTITVGEDFTLTATVVPSGSEVTYTSSDSTTASVTSAGVVTGEQAGTATITATITVDGQTYTDTCAVTVEAAG